MKWAGFKIVEKPTEHLDILGRTDYDNGIILIDSALKGETALEIALHEGLHALDPDMSEEKVTNTARQLAHLLWKLGYRRKK